MTFMGTTKFFFKANPDFGPSNLTHGAFYLELSFHSGNVIRSGHWWDKATSIAVTTNGTLAGAMASDFHNINMATDLPGGQHSKSIPGLNTDIISKIPAIPDTVDVTVKYVVSNHDPLDDIINLAKDGHLATLLNFSVGTTAVVNSLASIVPSIVNLFRGGATPVTSEALSVPLHIDLDQNPQPGYYIAFANQNEANHEIDALVAAIDSHPDQIAIGETVTFNGNPLTDTSYVALELHTYETLDTPQRPDEPWVKQYKKAMDSLDTFDNTADAQAQSQVLKDVQSAFATITSLMEDDRVFTDADKQTDFKKLMDKYKAVHNGLSPQVIAATVK